MTLDDPQRAYRAIHEEATALAGGLTDLGQRATVYHHLYRASGGNHVFPLIAAHGALWAGGYFRFGLRLGRWLSWQYLNGDVRRRQLAALDAFADVFRDVNRRVCIDTYTNLHFTARFGNHPDAALVVPMDLLDALQRVHAAERRGVVLDNRKKLAIFQAHFLHEQARVVGPALEAAVQAFDWPLVKAIALRPIIRFAYFPHGQWFWFRNFSLRQERIERGMTAFELGARVGWDRVENALRDYRVLPEEFFRDNRRHFVDLREAVLHGSM